MGRSAAPGTGLTTGRRTTAIKRLLSVLVVLLDAGMLVCAFVVGYYARLYLPIFARPELSSVPRLTDYWATLGLHVGIILFIFYFTRLYHLPRVVSRIDLARSIISMVTVGSVLVFGVQEFIFKGSRFEVDYPRSMFTYITLFSALFVTLGREWYRMARERLRRTGFDVDKLLLVGAGAVAYDIATRVRQHPELGYRVVGLVTPNGTVGESLPNGVPILGDYNALPTLIDSLSVEQVIIALGDADRAQLVELIANCQRGRVDIKVYPDVLAYMAGDMNLDDLGGTPLITVRDIALRGWKLSLKRALDIIGAGAGLVLLSPLLLLTAVLVRLDSAGPVFYTQERMGLDGRRFHMVKFRTMRPNADQLADWTIPGDPRVTRLGALMRRTNWDELPQLINVLLGEMSLVGPRPEQPVHVEAFRQHIPRYMERHREKAGMTGWAQVNGLRGDTSIAERTSYDLWYVENWSLWLDIKIILRTVYQTLTRSSQNAY